MSQQSADLPDTIPPRRFEYADDKSYKFWTIALSGTRLTTRYGRIGYQGQTREVRFDSAEDAKRDYAKRILQKTIAGYEERLPAKKKVVTSDAVWQQLAPHEPFLQAILEQPDEVSGYAIYADWLLEQKDPRGEFTQLQLALEDPSLPLYKRPKLEKAAKLLKERNARQWLGNLAPWLMDDHAALYGYNFYRGQLSSIACYAMSLKFASELKRSPYCRLLRELFIHGIERLGDETIIHGHHYEPGRDYGVEPLLGADFSNLRDFRAGTMPEEYIVAREFSKGMGPLVQLVESMPRLERLSIESPIDVARLLQNPLPNLTSLQLSLTPPQVAQLAASGIVPRLSMLGLLCELTEEIVDELVAIPGFDQLTQFSCSEMNRLPEAAMEKLRSTGVVLDVLNFPPEPLGG